MCSTASTFSYALTFFLMLIFFVHCWHIVILPNLNVCLWSFIYNGYPTLEPLPNIILPGWETYYASSNFLEPWSLMLPNNRELPLLFLLSLTIYSIWLSINISKHNLILAKMLALLSLGKLWEWIDFLWHNVG